MTMTSETRNLSGPNGPSPSGGGGRPRPPGWYIPWMFVAFFLVVVAANATMIWLATSTFTGVQTENHFIQGIRYNETLEAAKAQAERGWKVDFTFAAPGGQKGAVDLSLRDRHGNLLSGSTVVLSFVRPTTKGFDFDLQPTYLGDGRWRADVDLPLPGVWDVRVRIEHPTGDYQDEKRIWVK